MDSIIQLLYHMSNQPQATHIKAFISDTDAQDQFQEQILVPLPSHFWHSTTYISFALDNEDVLGTMLVNKITDHSSLARSTTCAYHGKPSQCTV